ncbi:MAG: hypothetical protein HC875_30030, partial [Anaerolineales bacterium]|nr:hypothetical protein [Anaerolineales bacterium]
MSRQDDLRKLIETHHRHLQKLNEQKASFGLFTPPHILLEIENQEAEIAKLQAELENIGNEDPVVSQPIAPNNEKTQTHFPDESVSGLSRTQEPPYPKEQLPPKRVVVETRTAKQILLQMLKWGVPGLILGGVSVWMVITFISSHSSPPSTPTPAEGELTIPELPDMAPPLTTTIAIASFANCPDTTAQISQELEARYSELNPPLSIKQLSGNLANSEEARLQGQQNKADLVIWGECDQTNVTSNFEILSARGAPEVYEPEFLSISGSIPTATGVKESKLFLTINAMSLYLRRDYENAGKAFGTVATLEADPKTKAELYLMQGNSFLFAYQYEKAKTTFLQANEPKTAPATHNLGIAYANIGWNTGELAEAIEAYSQTLTLDPDFALAYINRSQARQWIGIRLVPNNETLQQYTLAENDCEQAENIAHPDTLLYSLTQACLR